MEVSLLRVQVKETVILFIRYQWVGFEP
jgi:hypothetical protein